MRAKLVLFFSFLLILFFPSQLGRHFWPGWSIIEGLRIDYLSPTLLFTDLLGLMFVIFARPRLLRQSLPWLILPALNISFSALPQAAFFHWLRLIFYYLIFLSFQKYLPYFKKYWLIALSLSVIWSAVLAILQFITGSNLGGLWYWLGERPLSLGLPYIAKVFFPGLGYLLRPYATFPHPNALAGYLSVALLLVFQHQNYLKKLTLTLGILALLLTFSKTILFPLIPFFPKTQLLPPIAERFLLVNNSINIIKQSPLTGTGLGVYPAAAYHLPSTGLQLSYQPVHNIFILLLAELGLPMFIVVIILMIKTLKNPFQFIILVILVTGFVDHYWITSPSNLLLLTLALSFRSSNY